jgi:hypothetical protein
MNSYRNNKVRILSVVLMIMALTAVFLSASCTSTTTTTISISPSSAAQIQISLGQQATLSPGQTAAVNNEDLAFWFIKVSGDSRCPTGVQCIQAGDAKCDVLFLLNNTPTKITLIDKGGTEGFTQTQFNQYTLSFRADPYPVYGKTIAPGDYKLLITVTK